MDTTAIQALAIAAVICTALVCGTVAFLAILRSCEGSAPDDRDGE